MSNYFVEITKVEKIEFTPRKNYCDYFLDVYNSNKKKIGTANCTVIQPGTDYYNVFEALFDIEKSGDKEELAYYLDVEEIPEEWYDNNGNIDVDKLPQKQVKICYDHWDSMLTDYYYREEFAEDYVEKWLIPLEVFSDKLTFRTHYHHEREGLDFDLTTLQDLFEDVDGWYEPDDIGN